MGNSPTGVFKAGTVVERMSDMDISGIGEIIRGLAAAAMAQPLLAMLALAPIAGLLDK